MTPKRVDHATRREEILAAAVRVFGRKGYAASRIDDVAAEAGIAKGTVYLYFDSREALLDAAFAAFAARSERVVDRARRGSEPPLDRLAALVRSVLEMLTAERDLAWVLLDLWSAGRGHRALPIDMAAVYRECRDVVTGLFHQAEAAGELRPGLGEPHAAVVVGAIEGCVLQWLLDPRLPIDELAEPILEMSIDGLRRKEAA